MYLVMLMFYKYIYDIWKVTLWHYLKFFSILYFYFFLMLFTLDFIIIFIYVMYLCIFMYIVISVS